MVLVYIFVAITSTAHRRVAIQRMGMIQKSASMARPCSFG